LQVCHHQRAAVVVDMEYALVMHSWPRLSTGQWATTTARTASSRQSGDRHCPVRLLWLCPPQR
jgi:hypothetical protein